MSIQGFSNSSSINKINSIEAQKANTDEMIKNANNVETEEMVLDIMEKFESAHPKENEEIKNLESEGFKAVYDELIPVTKGNPPQDEKARIMLFANEEGKTEKRIFILNKETNTYEKIESEELKVVLDLVERKYIQENIARQAAEELSNIKL